MFSVHIFNKMLPTRLLLRKESDMSDWLTLPRMLLSLSNTGSDWQSSGIHRQI